MTLAVGRVGGGRDIGRVGRTRRRQIVHIIRGLESREHPTAERDVPAHQTHQQHVEHDRA
jgi:hypothetical protein